MSSVPRAAGPLQALVKWKQCSRCKEKDMVKLAGATTVDAAFLATDLAASPGLQVSQLLCSPCDKHIRWALDSSAARVESDAHPPPSAMLPPPAPVRQSSAAAVEATVVTVPEGVLFLFALLSLFERLTLFFFFSSLHLTFSIVFVLPVVRAKSATSFFVVSLLMHSHVVYCFLFLFFPYAFAAASTSPASGRRPTCRTHPYPARTFTLFRHRCDCSDLYQGRHWRAHVLVHHDHATAVAWIGGNRRGPCRPGFAHPSPPFRGRGQGV